MDTTKTQVLSATRGWLAPLVHVPLPLSGSDFTTRWDKLGAGGAEVREKIRTGAALQPAFVKEDVLAVRLWKC